MEGTIFLLVAATFAAVHTAPTDPTGVEIPCSLLEFHFVTEGRRLFTNGEANPSVTCSRQCISPRGRVMRYYYCCSGYEPLVASSSSRTILDAVADHVICVPSTTAAAPTASSKLEMRECPSRNQPQSLNDFVYAIQVDLCRYGCIYQETVDEQSGVIRNVTKIFYGCCPPHVAVAAGAIFRPTYTCATAEEMSDPNSSANITPTVAESTQKSEVPSDAPKPPIPPRDMDVPKPSKVPTTDAPKPSTAPTTDVPQPSITTTGAAPHVPSCPDSSVPQTTNQFAVNSQTRLCTFSCTYEEADDLGFDTVTRLVTKTIYGCCSPYMAVAVGAVNRPVYECQ